MTTATAPFREYLNKDISTIPCRKVWDEKKKIYTANSDLIKNPNLIKPGWIIKIPKEYIK